MIYAVIDLYRCGEWYDTTGKDLRALPQKSDWIVYKDIKYQITEVIYYLNDDTIRIKATTY